MTEKDMEDVLQIRKALDELAVGLHVITFRNLIWKNCRTH